MRTTVRLDERLLTETKKLAADTHRSVTAVIEDALREVLWRRKHRKPRKLLRLPVVDGRGTLPGVDLDDAAALLSVMDGEHAPS